MNKLLFSILLIPTILFAEPVKINKTVVCDSFRSVVETLEREFGEVPFWVGNGKDIKTAIFRNPNTNTWTVIQFNATMACVISEGEGFALKN